MDTQIMTLLHLLPLLSENPPDPHFCAESWAPHFHNCTSSTPAPWYTASFMHMSTSWGPRT